MDSTNTFVEWLDLVLREREEDGMRGIASEKNRADVHVRPASFSTKPIGDVRSSELREWLREMQQKPAKDTRGERTICRDTVARSWALVRVVFTVAHEREIIPTNPCAGIKLKRRADERATKEPWAYFTPDEQERLATCPDVPEAHRLQIMFAIYTGLRQGEMFNLPLADLHVDGERPHVHVRFGSKNKPPKSGKSRRVPLHPKALAVAKRWLEVLPTYATENPEALVFPSPNGKRRAVGKPLGRTRVDGRWVCGWRAATIAAGVKRARWHDCRHTCASSLIAGWWGKQWTIEMTRDLMGHSSVIITQRYGHLAESVLEQAARETVTSEPAVSPRIANDNAPGCVAGLLKGLIRAARRRVEAA